MIMKKIMSLMGAIKWVDKKGAFSQKKYNKK